MSDFFVQDSWHLRSNVTLNYGCVGTSSRRGKRNTTSFKRLCWASSPMFIPERPRDLYFLATPVSLAPSRRRNTTTSPRASALPTPRIDRMACCGRIFGGPGKTSVARRLRPFLHRIRRTVGRHYERQPALWLRLHQSRSASICHAFCHGGERSERWPALPACPSQPLEPRRPSQLQRELVAIFPDHRRSGLLPPECASVYRKLHAVFGTANCAEYASQPDAMLARRRIISWCSFPPIRAIPPCA